MLMPLDKIRNKANDICQIVVTRNCCVFSCSNCTQLLPFRKDVRNMSLECVEEAIASMRGWPGVIAIFGGNPVVHPQFPEICEIVKRLIPNQAQRGLWTNNLHNHGDLIRETFWPHGRFNLNVHGDLEAAAEMNRCLPGKPIFGESGRDHHGGMLMDYRDYGLTEEQWIEKREKCDINQNWSAGIYERDGRPYAYFCEVAGSLDGVRGENNGVLAEPGWWLRPIEAFDHQIKRCCDRGCGVPLRTVGHEDREAVYDISPSWAEATATRTGKVEIQVHETLPQESHELTDYLGLRLPGKK